MSKKRAFHIYGGLVLSLFIVCFCVSGIVLNHRELFSKCEVSRSLLPERYAIKNYNNGAVKGTLPLDSLRTMVYGNSGIFITDNDGDFILKNFNNGITGGVDRRKCSRIMKDSLNNVFAALQFDVYRLDTKNNEWKQLIIEGLDERITDIELKGDSLIVLSRSNLYVAPIGSDMKFTQQSLLVSQNYECKTSLMKIVWKLHSGELFGIAGRLVVDAIAVVMLFLCVTGWLYYLCPKLIKRQKDKASNFITKLRSTLKFSTKEHIRIGRWTFYIMLVVIVTGTCLRPPFMIPLAITKVSSPSSNPFGDKLRGIRYDEGKDLWLFCTTDGFFQTKLLNDTLQQIKNAPTISPMGINVFEPTEDGKWLVGSFSGLKIWDVESGEIKDFFTTSGNASESRYGLSKYMVNGYSKDLSQEIVFDYSQGALDIDGNIIKLPENDILEIQPISLWNAMLELHVGRVFPQIFGSGNMMYVFVIGTLITTMLICGKRKRKQ